MWVLDDGPFGALAGVVRATAHWQAGVLHVTEAVADAVGRLRASELERAREVWRKKFGTQPTDAAERGKQMRFLASRGFGGDTIHRVVSGGDED